MEGLGLWRHKYMYILLPPKHMAYYAWDHVWGILIYMALNMTGLMGAWSNWFTYVFENFDYAYETLFCQDIVFIAKLHLHFTLSNQH